MGTQSLIKYITETNSKATEADQINPYIIVLKIYGNNVKPKWNQPLRSNLALRKFYAYNNTVGGVVNTNPVVCSYAFRAII